MMDEVVVQAGGHVTLLFSIHSKPLLARNQGSRGAGLCLEDGAEVTAKIIEKGPDNISVTHMDGQDFPEGEDLYVDLLASFREIFKVESSVQIDVKLELPISQGFGMSGAGLLAASLALGEIFDCGDEGQLARLAHRLERKHSGGLGDILGLWAGGCELRITPGSPPFPGKAVGFDVGCPALLVWDPERSTHTGTYIDNSTWKSKITTAGESAVNRLKKFDWNQDIWENLLDEADRFALESGLLEEEERAKLLNIVLEKADESMSCHICMLGTSLIILPKKLNHLPDYGELSSILRSLGLGVFETILQ
jgi:pantoate kinase